MSMTMNEYPQRVNELTLDAQSKINWRLKITGCRKDGYHTLDMIMQTISLHDTLKITVAHDNSLRINNTCVENCEENLVIKAAQALSQYTGKRIIQAAQAVYDSSDCAQALL